ncbi:MAG TPA: hypothetical protein VGO08_04515 [Burkholderiales bacterium]|nr:hypothetical protein [Burkholderiales bacterium]
MHVYDVHVPLVQNARDRLPLLLVRVREHAFVQIRGGQPRRDERAGNLRSFAGENGRVMTGANERCVDLTEHLLGTADSVRPSLR